MATPNLYCINNQSFFEARMNFANQVTDRWTCVIKEQVRGVGLSLLSVVKGFTAREPGSSGLYDEEQDLAYFPQSYRKYYEIGLGSRGRLTH